MINSDIAVPTSGGLLRVMNNAQLDAANKVAIPMLEPAPVLTGLAGFVTRCWEEAKRHRDSNVLPRLLSAQLARAGKYEPDILAKIREFGGSEEYARITANKCRIAEAWLRDIYIGQTERPLSVDPTPSPTIPENVRESVREQLATEFASRFLSGEMMDEAGTREMMDTMAAATRERIMEVARAAAGNMERLILDQMEEGGFTVAMAEFISDLVVYPAAHFKAPVLRRRKAMKWSNASGAWAPTVADEILPEFNRVDPFRIFPAPGVSDPQDGYIIELVSLQRGELYSLIGVEGFNEEAIRRVLEQFSTGGLTDWHNQSVTSMQTRAVGELPKDAGSANVTIDAVEYHGPVQGRQLVEWGFSPKDVQDPDEDYEACVWLIGREVIKAQLNYDPLGRRPYYKTSFEESPGSYWGSGLPDVLGDVQGVANAALRAMVNNAAYSSGPMVGVNSDRLPPGEDLTKLTPLQVFQFTESETGSNTKALEFFQPDSRVAELSGLLENMYKLADDFSMLPRFMSSGQTTGGIGRSASGVSMLLDTSFKGLKGVVLNIDVRIISGVLKSMYDFNMLFSTDPSVKGDSKVSASGATSLMQKETLQLRRNEFLTATNNPTDLQIVGVEGRAEVLRTVADGLQMDTTRVVPPRELLAKRLAPPAEAGQQAPGQNGQNEQTLANGAAVTNNFSRNSMTPS